MYNDQIYVKIPFGLDEELEELIKSINAIVFQPLGDSTLQSLSAERNQMNNSSGMFFSERMTT